MGYMGNYEQSNTEGSRGNRNTDTRNEVFNKISASIIREATDKRAKARETLRRQSQGNGKYIMNGSNDRVNGKIYDGDNKALYASHDDEMSYFYGYTHHGSRRLLAVVEALQKQNRIDEIIQIGYRDFNHGIEEDYLGMLKQNAYYIEGYNAAQKAEKTR